MKLFSKAFILLFIFSLSHTEIFSQPTYTDSLNAALHLDSLIELKHKKFEDSILNQLQIQKHLFENWSISKINFINANTSSPLLIQKINQRQYQDILFYVLILLSIFVAGFKIQYHKEFNDLFTVFGTLNRNQIMFRSKTGSIPWISVLLNVFSITIFSIYLWLLLLHFNLGISVSGQKLIVLIGICITSIIAIRYLSIVISSGLFSTIKELKFYSFYEMQLVRVLAIILLPLLVIISFANSWLQQIAFPISWILFLLFFLFRIFRGIQIGGNYLSKSKFHFIIYICALEIAPFLIIVKLVLTRTNF